MPRKKPAEEAKKGAPEWMTTYGDMVTLLLCFFVLLFAFSEIDVRKLDAFIQSFQGAVGVLEAGRTIEPSEILSEAELDDLTLQELQELEDFRRLQERLAEFLEERDMQADVLVTLETRGLVLRFQDNVLFDSGRSEIKTDSLEILDFVGMVIREPEFYDKFVRIEGHTDTDPLRPGARYETNWELSVARAANVVRYMIEELNVEPVRFSASGYGEYHPVAPNDTAENKSKNRRVDIVILRSEFTATSR
ncbi:flagellar motor protein MotB [Anoxynatronum buryatiense]|uniref:Chemotaxis protein MotB n=1 Tax=Anoxynatronum buryatiense TaxID=489973 RepID=A0AA45WUM6_9CLOT|nr:flagellar motor protein MotB [Anoxynatronum buryatiense]SMP47320.1 chemotaxis protein MotB [Anoxynatronum buryatiense]